MQELNIAEIEEVSGAGFFYDLGHFWGRAFANGGWEYPMNGGQALGA